VEWFRLPNGEELALEDEIEALERQGVFAQPHDFRKLAKACRKLVNNAEENREYPTANEFHYWSMNALRLGGWSVVYEALLKEEVRRDIWEGEQRNIRFKDLWPPTALDIGALLRKDTWHYIRDRNKFGLVNSLYWALSGYGVRAARACWALIAIWAAFTTLYVLVAPPEFEDFGHGIGFLWQASVYSLLALARLNPEPRPEEPGVFQFLVGLEGIFGPLQIALLALAIRRQVMR
jgi:hypothetical protein